MLQKMLLGWIGCYTHTRTHSLIYTLLLPFCQCETTLMGTTTGFNRQWRERRPAGPHDENYCVQKESISAFQCNSIPFTKGREAILKWKCHLTSSRGERGVEKEGGPNLFIWGCCVLRYLSFSTAWLYTLLLEVRSMRQQQPCLCGCVCVFALAGYLLRAISSCIPLEQGTFLQNPICITHRIQYVCHLSVPCYYENNSHDIFLTFYG